MVPIHVTARFEGERRNLARKFPLAGQRISGHIYWSALV